MPVAYQLQVRRCSTLLVADGAVVAGCFMLTGTAVACRLLPLVGMITPKCCSLLSAHLLSDPWPVSSWLLLLAARLQQDAVLLQDA